MEEDEPQDEHPSNFKNDEHSSDDDESIGRKMRNVDDFYRNDD